MARYSSRGVSIRRPMSAMKYHSGDTVEWWWSDLFHYDVVYMSKVFGNTYTPDHPDFWPVLQVRPRLRLYDPGCHYTMVAAAGGDSLERVLCLPRELYRANGFPDDYKIDRDYTGREYGKTKQVARCGNAVPPPFATALVRANLPEWCGEEITTMEQLEKAVAV